ncbi:MAG: signal peptidase I, partial [Acidimicrobiales bacterium]
PLARAVPALAPRSGSLPVVSSSASQEPPVAGGVRADTASRPAPAPPRRHLHRRAVVEWVVILGIAVLAAFLIRTFVVEPFFIPSGSMEPTLQVNDRVLVNKLSYDLHPVHRGDIVVFRKPPNDVSPGISDLIKRVIGLPGETISAHGGSVYINGQKLAEPWLPKGVTTAAFGPVHIPKGDYFMMGDNRGDSADSRVIGPVSAKLFVGRAFVRVWPLSRLGGL